MIIYDGEYTWIEGVALIALYVHHRRRLLVGLTVRPVRHHGSGR